MVVAVMSMLNSPPTPPPAYTTYPNLYPARYSVAPAHLAGTIGKQNISFCLETCTTKRSSPCIGFTACTPVPGGAQPDGCYLYSDMGGGGLAYSPVCDWYEAPWG